MRAVGESLQRVDAIKKVTGQAQYVDDIIMPRMLYAQVKRSPYPHARILRIDTSKAEALPGVRSVITGDCYTKRCGLYLERPNTGGKPWRPWRPRPGRSPTKPWS